MNSGRCVLAALLLLASPLAAALQEDTSRLITRAGGRWEERDAGGRTHRLNGKYDCLRPNGDVRCLEADVSRCELRYLTGPASTATRRLPVRIDRSGQWMRLRGLPPPPAPVLATTAAALARHFTRYTKPGGSRSGSGCGGDFPLHAPACGETLDVSGFKVRWPAADGAAGNLLLLVERVDGSPAVFRRTPPLASGEFGDADLTRFLLTHQSKGGEAVDVTVRVRANDGRSAVRLVRIPPSSRTEEYESRVAQIVVADPLAKAVNMVSLAMEEGMWSRAAQEALPLIDLAAGSPDLLEYAVAGVCQSDLEDAKSRIRKLVADETWTAICGTASVPAAPAMPPPVEAAAAGEEVPARTRLGVALLIGNWDYWNLPLNSVKSDLQNMKEALEAASFDVTVRENAKTPRQFLDALDDTLKEHKAGSEDVLLVYYSGHGVQLDGKAHLLGTGVSANAQVAEDVRANAQSAEGLLAEMERSLPGARVLVVEACRDSFATAAKGADGRAVRAGFAFQQDDVPNTFVMFANRPGLPSPARSDFGLMGPFTESLIYAMQNSSGEILEVFDVASRKTTEISAGQEPVMHRSKSIGPLFLKRTDAAPQDNRARDLLNAAEPLYRSRAWDDFLAAVDRGRVLAAAPDLRERFSRETGFARRVKEAEELETTRKWSEAADKWQAAAAIFPARQWALMRAAVAWLLAGDLTRATRPLGMLAAQPEGDAAAQARQLLADLVKAFPDLEGEARKAGQDAVVAAGPEFEQVK
jgi:hypothetical protein